jgi:hypothetical protein
VHTNKNKTVIYVSVRMFCVLISQFPGKFFFESKTRMKLKGLNKFFVFFISFSQFIKNTI